MGKRVTIALGVVLLALWIVSGLRAQPAVKGDQATVRAQFTALTQPSPTPTPTVGS